MHAFLAWSTRKDQISTLVTLSQPEDRFRLGRAVSGSTGTHRLAAYGLARSLLFHAGLDAAATRIERRPSGQPYLMAHSDVTISASYSDVGVAACIGFCCDVGVDIETERNQMFWRNIDPSFAPGVKDANSLLMAWVASEACAKSHGMGIPAFLCNPVPFSIDGPPTQRITWNGLGARDVMIIPITGGQLAISASAGAEIETFSPSENAALC